MIQRNRAQRLAYALGEYADLVCGAAVILFGAVNDVSVETYSKWPGPLPGLIATLQDKSLGIWIIIAAFTLAAWWVRRRGDPWFWDKLQTILDEAQEAAFSEFPDHIKDHHRVTLFRYQGWCWRLSTMVPGRWPWSLARKRCPWSGWLVPILRSGRTSQNTKAIFMVGDDGDKAEGVAGSAWARNRSVVVLDLPQVSEHSKDRHLTRYADSTFCPLDMVKGYIAAKRPLPRSIAAIPLEVNSNPWGVLVIDSREPTGVTHETIDNLAMAIKSISHLLEKAR